MLEIVQFYASATIRTVLEAFCVRAVCSSVHVSMMIYWKCVYMILTTGGNFMRFTTLMRLGARMNWLDFEVNRSKVEITTRPNALFWQRRADRQFVVKYQLACWCGLSTTRMATNSVKADVFVPSRMMESLIFWKCMNLVIAGWYVINQPPKANSAFHPCGVSKWVPASAGKAKAGMVHSVSGWTRGVQVKLRSIENACHTWRLRGVFMMRCYTNPPLPLSLLLP